jgi:NitT/TauT family transport system permease protein
MPATSDAPRGLSPAALLALRVILLVALFLAWYALVSLRFLPAFFFGRPFVVLQRVGQWFTTGKIYPHLGVTLVETVLAFAVGTLLGVAAGLWLGLRPLASALLEPYIKAANAMPRVILAPIFAVWFGLGIASKVALGVTLVFFIVFFNVYQGVREVSPTVLASVRMLGA